jgi:hypothetical protein
MIDRMAKCWRVELSSGSTRVVFAALPLQHDGERWRLDQEASPGPYPLTSVWDGEDWLGELDEPDEEVGAHPRRSSILWTRKGSPRATTATEFLTAAFKKDDHVVFYGGMNPTDVSQKTVLVVQRIEEVPCA